MANGNNRRIGNFTAVAMTTVALILDLIEIVLVFFGIGLIINRLITFVEYSIFILWFWMLDVNFTKLTNKNAEKRLIIMITTAVIEMIPGIGALPAFTFGVVRMIIVTRAEDRSLLNERMETVTKGRVLNREKLRIQERKAA